mgnify:CR=1 FL=1
MRYSGNSFFYLCLDIKAIEKISAYAAGGRTQPIIYHRSKFLQLSRIHGQTDGSLQYIYFFFLVFGSWGTSNPKITKRPGSPVHIPIDTRYIKVGMNFWPYSTHLQPSTLVQLISPQPIQFGCNVLESCNWDSFLIVHIPFLPRGGHGSSGGGGG